MVAGSHTSQVAKARKALSLLAITVSPVLTLSTYYDASKTMRRKRAACMNPSLDIEGT